MQITIYTDGACDIHADNRPGGWAAIICATDGRGEVLKETVLSGGQEMTTNNKMELTAVIEALKHLKRPSAVTITTDSRYVIDIATNRNRIRKNLEIWRQYFEAEAGHTVSWEFVEGHSGDEYNERCDKLAVAERKKLTRSEFEPVEARSTVDSEASTAVYLASKYSTEHAQTSWSAYIISRDKSELLGGLLNDKTNYETILIGVIKTLNYLGSGNAIKFFTSNDTLANGANEWIYKWKDNDWTYISGEEGRRIRHLEHWQALLELKQQRAIEFEYDKSLRNSKQYKLAKRIAELMLKAKDSGIDPDYE